MEELETVCAPPGLAETHLNINAEHLHLFKQDEEQWYAEVDGQILSLSFYFVDAVRALSIRTVKKSRSTLNFGSLKLNLQGIGSHS